MLFFILLLCVILLTFLHYSIRGTKAGRNFDQIPGPKNLPVLGNVLEFLLPPKKLFQKARSLFETYKGINRILLMHIRLVNIYEPDHIEMILSNTRHTEKKIPYIFLKSWLREGLLISNGEKWQHRRKILTPAFHFNILKHFCKILDKQSKTLVENLKGEVGNVRTDIKPYITKCTLNTMCETSMGISLGSPNSPSTDESLHNYFNAIHKLGKISVTRLVRFWLYNDWIFKLTSLGKLENSILKYLHGFTTKVIKGRRDMRDDFKDVLLKCKRKQLALLDLLLEAEVDGKIDEIGIREEVDTFMFEGHDTTAMALSFAVMTLANEPEVQEKIHEECLSVFGKKNGTVSIEQLSELKYLECCIKECLRMYPVVPFIARHLQQDIQIDRYTIPANTTCNIHIFDLHRNPNIYESPLEFKPERFTPENSIGRHPFAYIPFSAGPRNCIGQKFAMLELKSVLSSIILTYKLEPVTKHEDLELFCDIVLRTKKEIFVKLRSRESN